LETRVTFLGTSTAVPEPLHDTASFLINRDILVDVGWNATLRMAALGFDPLEITYLIITHCHHDHYLSLPALLFYRMMMGRRRGGLKPLEIIGPAEDIGHVVDLALAFLQADRFELDACTRVVGLNPGDAVERPGFRLDTIRTLHPVPGLCYRYTNVETGARFVFTGDTAFHPGIAEHAKGCSVLIHEASWGATAADPTNNSFLHSGAPDAAHIAKMAGVSQLFLIHAAAAQIPGSLAVAREIFSDVRFPEDGDSVVIPPGA